jgi:hypothetical protein
MPITRHPGPPNSISGDGEFVGANAPLRPLAASASTVCANAFLDAGLQIARVTCSTVTCRPGGKREVRAVIRPYERREVKVVIEINNWPAGEDVFGVADQAAMEYRLGHLFQRLGIVAPEVPDRRGGASAVAARRR